MNHQSALATLNETAAFPQHSWNLAAPLKPQMAKREQLNEVLSFLAARPLHTVYLRSLIADNGLESPLNRGKFYCCRNTEGQLEGVALIGHAILIEARSEAALRAFALLAQDCRQGHMIMGEMEKIQNFWNYYEEGGQSPRLACRELLFEQRWPVEVHQQVRGLRQATLEDLELLLPVQAEMALEESGVNPMETDPRGFRLRLARRIEQGRVWILVEDGKMLFKADVMSSTPEVIYLEGIYVAPQERGHGLGLRCFSQLTRNLLTQAMSVSLLVNEQNQEAVAFYLKAGFKLRARYDTIFLRQAAH